MAKKRQILPIAVGQKVSYKSFGKLALLEGKYAQIVTGIVEEINEDTGMLTIYPSHRRKKSAHFHGMRTMLERKKVLQIIN